MVMPLSRDVHAFVEGCYGTLDAVALCDGFLGHDTLLCVDLLMPLDVAICDCLDDSRAILFVLTICGSLNEHK